MKSNLIVIMCFLSGIALGTIMDENIVKDITGLSSYILYFLVAQVGINIGANSEIIKIIKSIKPYALLLPVFTIGGTLLFSAAAAIFIDKWNIYDCMAVGSGFAYYSLSSILIVQLKEATAGADIASQLGAIALLSNIIREMLALIGAPLYASYFGKYAPVSVAGSISMDVCLPAISKYSGKDAVPVAIIHGIVLEISIPLLITMLCR